MFGNLAFCEAPFATQGVEIRIVSVSGVQVNTAIGTSTITGNATVTLSGNLEKLKVESQGDTTNVPDEIEDDVIPF